ncbi:DNA-3-methyladenine glycosylase I [Candidatus Woesearchaeota archaeon]|nr:DNA-3-methyladenine glycosylase I [Candidatus Woesearchaeota archaeon]
MPKQRVEKPKNDNEFLSGIGFIIFASGFRFSIVQSKFSLIKKAFSNFNIEKLSRFKEKEIDKLMKAEGMIKNRGKIESIIENAKICAEIRKEHGSVLKWIAKTKKIFNKDPMFNPSLDEAFQRFKRIGPITSGWMSKLHNSKKEYYNFEVPG